MYNIIELPGINKISFRSFFFQDFLFFIIIVAVPSSFFALLPSSIFHDLKLFFMLISSIYILFYFKYLKKIMNIPSGNFLILLNIYLLFQILYSLFIKEIPFSEIIAVFRANFFYPIATLSFLLYTSSMNNNRIYRLFYWLLLATLIQGALYVISNLTGVDFFASGSRSYDFKGAAILQNMQAIPHYNEILFTFGFLAVLTTKNFNKHWIWVIPLIVTIISIVRSQMIVYGMVLLLILFLTKYSNLKLDFSKIVKIILLSLSFVVLLSILFPSHISRVINKFGIEKKETLYQKGYLEAGNYAFRLELIKDAYNRIEKNDNTLLGNGYIREAKQGKYDFVLGDDTLIAPVVFTEGILGLIIRILPIVMLLVYFTKLLLSTDIQYKILAIFSIAIILPEFFNIVQTKLFIYYTREMFILYLITMIIYNDKSLNYQKEKNAT